MVAAQSQKVMVFVDGTNFLREFSKDINISFRADKAPATSFQCARILIDSVINRYWRVFRRFWFASYQGNDEDYDRMRTELRAQGFEPVLFKRKNGREKGVDIALTIEMLVNAFNQNYTIGFLVAGDEDYVGIVKAVKQYGPEIWGVFFDRGLSNELRLACDNFIKFGNRPVDRERWQQCIDNLKREVSETQRK